MTFDESIDTLNIELGDTQDVTFTIEEKERAMTKAWNDQFTIKTVWDSSLTYSTMTFQYSIPSGVNKVKDIYIKPGNSSSEKPQKISSNLWEVVDGNIQFKNNANKYIPEGYTLYIKGSYKYTVADTIDETNIQEYVIALAGWETLRLLGYKKANLFLKNDTSMSELIALKNNFRADVQEMRNRLPREFEVI